MTILRAIIAILFAIPGLAIVASAIVVPAAGKWLRNPIEAHVPTFQDHGLTPGLVLLSTAVILLFLPRSPRKEDRG